MDAPKLAVTAFCPLFGCPTGDFRLARLPYSMIFAFKVPLLGRKITLRQVKAKYQKSALHIVYALAPAKSLATICPPLAENFFFAPELRKLG